MDPDDGGSFWGLALLVQLLVKLSQGVDGGVGEQLVHLRVSLKNTEAMITLVFLRVLWFWQSWHLWPPKWCSIGIVNLVNTSLYCLSFLNANCGRLILSKHVIVVKQIFFKSRFFSGFVVYLSPLLEFFLKILVKIVILNRRPQGVKRKRYHLCHEARTYHYLFYNVRHFQKHRVVDLGFFRNIIQYFW